MYYLIYKSESEGDFNKDRLFEILEKSRKKNAQKNISGFLLCINEDLSPELINGKFIQILEGEKEDVKALYNKIKEDPRHKNVKVISEGVTMKRIFHSWNMGHRDFDILSFRSILKQFDLKEEELMDENKAQEHQELILDFIKSFYKTPIKSQP